MNVGNDPTAERWRSGRRLDTVSFENGVEVPRVARRGAALQTLDGEEEEMHRTVESVASQAIGWQKQPAS